MDALLREYLAILIFLGVATGLSVVFVIASLIAGRQKPDSEKLSAYECGFEAFGDARTQRHYALFFEVVDGAQVHLGGVDQIVHFKPSVKGESTGQAA